MKTKAIKTEREHHAALKRIEKLWDATPDTPESKSLDRWVTLVESYEEKHHAIELPVPNRNPKGRSVKAR